MYSWCFYNAAGGRGENTHTVKSHLSLSSHRKLVPKSTADNKFHECSSHKISPPHNYPRICIFGFSSVQFSHSVMSHFFDPWIAARQDPCPSPIPGVHSNPCPLSRWCHPTISSSVVCFSSCPQSFQASRSFQISQLFISGGQSIGVSFSTSVLSMNTQDWSPLEWTGWISSQSKGLSRVFSNTTVQNHQFFSTQLSL